VGSGKKGGKKKKFRLKKKRGAFRAFFGQEEKMTGGGRTSAIIACLGKKRGKREEPPKKKKKKGEEKNLWGGGEGGDKVSFFVIVKGGEKKKKDRLGCFLSVGVGGREREGDEKKKGRPALEKKKEGSLSLRRIGEPKERGKRVNSRHLKKGKKGAPQSPAAWGEGGGKRIEGGRANTF